MKPGAALVLQFGLLLQLLSLGAPPLQMRLVATTVTERFVTLEIFPLSVTVTVMLFAPNVVLELAAMELV